MLRMMVVGLMALVMVLLAAAGGGGAAKEAPTEADCNKPKAEKRIKLPKPKGFDQLPAEAQALVPVEAGLEVQINCGGAGKLSALRTTATPGWYRCYAESWVKNSVGMKILRLRQHQDFYVSAYQTIGDWDPVDVETYSYLNWRPSGSTSIVGPKWQTYPWSIFSSAKQKFVLDYKLFSLQTKYLWTSIIAGPGNKCAGNFGVS